MSSGYLLDTNIAIAILINEGNAIEFIQQANREKSGIYFSTVSECEVFSGLKDEEHLHAEKLFTSKRCIDVTSEIAKMAGMIRRDQKIKGRNLKTPDALIIATAFILDLALVSRDSDMQFVERELEIPYTRI